jgi:GDPmannose 4,6-dehydratase
MSYKKVRKKTAVIFGVTGQDGSYMAELLLSKGYQVIGLVRRSSAPNTQRIDHLITEKKDSPFLRIYGDITDFQSIISCLQYNPQEIYNFAAQSHVKISFDIPEYTSTVVALGNLKILEAIKILKIKPKFLQASSSEMFGNSNSKYQDENTKFHPVSPYAAAKLHAYWNTRIYRDSYGIHGINAITFNHESPRRGINFVTKKIIRGLCEIKINTKKDPILLGNIYAKRDWGYAKEYCEIFYKLMQLKYPDDWVISTGRNCSIKNFINKVCKQLGIKISWKGQGEKEIGFIRNTKKIIIKIDPFFYRPQEVKNLKGINKKLKKAINWKPKYSLDQLIEIMIKEELKLIKNNSFY